MHYSFISFSTFSNTVGTKSARVGIIFYNLSIIPKGGYLLNKINFVAALILSLILIGCSDDKTLTTNSDDNSEKLVGTSNSSVEEEVNEEIPLEEIIFNTITETFEGNELTTNYRKKLIEEKINTMPAVELKEGSGVSEALERTFQLSLIMRANQYEDDNEFATDTNLKSIKVLKSLVNLLEENKISVVQLDWYAPSTQLENVEHVYYSMRFNSESLINLDWSAINEGNLLEHASYYDDLYKEI